jgi:hypothetical protein
LRVLGNARDDAELAWLGLSIAALGARARDPRLGRVDVGDREASNEPWPVVLEALNSATLRGSGKGAAGEGKLEQVVRLHGEKLRKACGGRPADILLCLAVLAHTPWLWEALVADEQLPVKDRSVLSRTRPEGRVEICARKAFA